jgi:cytoskeletal protein CcmA (bactofilin family)
MLFNRKPETRTAEPQARPPPLNEAAAIRRDGVAQPRTLIDASVAIVGDLRGEGDVQLDGHICGNVDCRQLIVGEDAAVTGAVTAEQVVVRGKITGTIRCRSVILQETARIDCDIVYGLLMLDEGARFEGSARRSSDPLNDEAALSALADLRRMLTHQQAAKPPCATDGNGLDAGAGLKPPPPDPDQGENGRAKEALRPGDGADR